MIKQSLIPIHIQTLCGLLSAIFTIITWTPTTFAQTAEESQLKSEAIGIVKKFAGQLKPRLLHAIEEGGPVHAISVCSEQAPGIARQLSTASGWQVKRVSLKARNDKTAIPDEWEHQVLEEFDRRQQQGESADKLVRAETVKDRFRFMKAQPVEPLCLICHGTNISDDVKAALASQYPNDQATGYSLGEIRGAFSLSHRLPEQDRQ